MVGMLSEMNLTPSVVRRDVENVRLYNQMIKMPNSRLNRQVFEYDMRKCLKNSWSANLISIAEHVDMVETVRSRSWLPLKLVQRCLMDMFLDVLKTSIENKPKLRTYCKLKDNFDPEGYLVANLDKHKRSLIC